MVAAVHALLDTLRDEASDRLKRELAEAQRRAAATQQRAQEIDRQRAAAVRAQNYPADKAATGEKTAPCEGGCEETGGAPKAACEKFAPETLPTSKTKIKTIMSLSAD